MSCYLRVWIVFPYFSQPQTKVILVQLSEKHNDNFAQCRLALLERGTQTPLIWGTIFSQPTATETPKQNTLQISL